VGDLLREIRKILATDREWTLCIVGVGNLGKAIVENAECEALLKHLKIYNYNKTKVAKVLGLSRTTLYEKMKKYNLEFGK